MWEVRSERREAEHGDSFNLERSRRRRSGRSKAELKRSGRSGFFINETRVATDATLGSVNGGAHEFGGKVVEIGN